MNAITITLPYPLSVNRYWMPVKMKTHLAILPTKEGKAYRQDVVWLLKAAGVKPIAGRIHLDIKLYPQRPQDWQKRMRVEGATWDDNVRCIDLDNANKVLLDAMKEIAFEDDKWVRKIVAERAEPDDKGARVVVTITSLAVEQPQELLFADLPA